jgi:hypothetical protein
VEYWHENIVSANTAQHNQSMVRLVLGNKCDAVAHNPSARRVSSAQGMELARRLGAPFLEVSARDASNVDVAFLNLARNLIAKRSVRQRCVVFVFAVIHAFGVVMSRSQAATPKRGTGMKLDSISSEAPKKNACCS